MEKSIGKYERFFKSLPVSGDFLSLIPSNPTEDDYKRLTIEYFFWEKLDDNAELALLKLGDDNLVKKYFSEYGLCIAAQLLLIKYGSDTLIREYISRHRFGPEAELELLMHGSTEQIREYISRHRFGPEAELELLMHGNAELFKKYIFKYNLCDRTKGTLIMLAKMNNSLRNMFPNVVFVKQHNFC